VLLPGRELEVDLRAPSGDRSEGPCRSDTWSIPGKPCTPAATAQLDPPPGAEPGPGGPGGRRPRARAPCRAGRGRHPARPAWLPHTAAETLSSRRGSRSRAPDHGAGALPSLRAGGSGSAAADRARVARRDRGRSGAETVTARLATRRDAQLPPSTGEIRRDGALLAMVPAPRGRPDAEPGRPARATDVLSALLDVGVLVDARRVIAVRRGAAVAPTESVRSTGAFALAGWTTWPSSSAGAERGRAAARRRGTGARQPLRRYSRLGGSVQGSRRRRRMLMITRPSRQPGRSATRSSRTGIASSPGPSGASPSTSACSSNCAPSRAAR